MRDPKRITYMMNLLTKIWEMQPDTRFNQLIHNLQWEYSNLRDNYKIELWEKEVNKINNDIHSYKRVYMIDLFNVEDDGFVEFLKEKLKE